MNQKELLRETRDGITWLTLNRPEAYNAFSVSLLHEFRNAINEIEFDDSTRVVIVTGSGDKSFCSGIDMREFGQLSQSETMKVRRQVMLPLFREMEAISKPIIAAVNGVAFGGGVELALAADIRISSEKASFGLREVKWGMMSSGGACQRLPLIVGLGRAKELLLTGKTIDANEAYRIGLANSVVPLVGLRDEAERFAREIAENAPLSVMQTKKAINTGAMNNLALAFDAECSTLTFFSRDRTEAMAAFAEKRKPEFTGE